MIGRFCNRFWNGFVGCCLELAREMGEESGGFHGGVVSEGRLRVGRVTCIPARAPRLCLYLLLVLA